MKRQILAFALVLAAVFALTFARYTPQTAADAQREQQPEEWVGYFFALEPFDGRRYAKETGDDYDFGVPGVSVFLTITAFEPGEPGYTENSDVNYSVGQAMSDEVEDSAMRVYIDDDGSRYEIDGDIALDERKMAELYECYVYRTADGSYYAVCTGAGYCGDGLGLARSETGAWTVNEKKKNRTVKVSVSFTAHRAAEAVVFIWMDGDGRILAREEYAASAIPGMLAAPEGAVLFLAAQESADGAVSRTLCTPEDASAKVYTPSAISGLLCVDYLTLDWGKAAGL